MMNKRETLSQDELEQLSRLYLDGQLTRLEEQELEYMLCRTTATSPAADEVRCLMQIAGQGAVACNRAPRSRFRLYSAAASMTLLIAAGIGFLASRSDRGELNCESFAVYVDGRRVEGNNALKIAEAARMSDMAMLHELMSEACDQRANDINLLHQISEER